MRLHLCDYRRLSCYWRNIQRLAARFLRWEYANHLSRTLELYQNLQIYCRHILEGNVVLPDSGTIPAVRWIYWNVFIRVMVLIHVQYAVCWIQDENVHDLDTMLAGRQAERPIAKTAVSEARQMSRATGRLPGGALRLGPRAESMPAVIVQGLPTKRAIC